MPVTASKLRENVYRILDNIIDTGEAVEIERRGRRLRILLADEDGPPARRRNLDALTARPDALRGDPLDIVHIDWSSEWRP
jgi:hypothetical protein